MQSLEQAILHMISASSEELQTFTSLCIKKSFKKKEVISAEEHAVNEVHFIEKGLVRVKITDLMGKEHTTHFARENEFICDYSAFLTGKKSNYQLEAMEDVDSIILTREAITWGYKNMKEGQKMGRIIAEYYYMYLDNRIQQMYTLTPIERYKQMSTIFPDIHNRAPQHMIASYLGITPIHLSRLKKELL